MCYLLYFMFVNVTQSCIFPYWSQSCIFLFLWSSAVWFGFISPQQYIIFDCLPRLFTTSSLGLLYVLIMSWKLTDALDHHFNIQITWNRNPLKPSAFFTFLSDVPRLKQFKLVAFALYLQYWPNIFHKRITSSCIYLGSYKNWWVIPLHIIHGTNTGN